MPQVKEPLLKRLVKKALNEAESSFGPDNTKFKIGVDVGNPQSETKLGLRIKLRPSEGYLEPEKKGELEAAIMTKMNNSLEQFNIQVSKDTDVPDPEIMGFFIPLPQLKNMIVSSLGGSTDTGIPGLDDISKPPSKPSPKPPTAKPPTDIQKGDEDDDKELNEEDGLDRAERRVKDLGSSMEKWKTGLNLKRSDYGDEQGGELTLQELYDKLSSAYELLVDVFKDIYQSTYKFKEYYDNNEDHVTRTMGVIAMMKDDVEDRLELEEPVGPDQGIEELKKAIKKLVQEQKMKDTSGVAPSETEFAAEYPELYQQAKDNYSGRPGDEGWEKWWTMFLPKGLIMNPYDDYYGLGGVVEGKKPINEVMRQKVLNEISGMVIKEDFYSFINAGNNIMRSLEERFDMRESKRYLEYLVKNNIM